MEQGFVLAPNTFTTAMMCVPAAPDKSSSVVPLWSCKLQLRFT